jgi:hypothetical protein
MKDNESDRTTQTRVFRLNDNLLNVKGIPKCLSNWGELAKKMAKNSWQILSIVFYCVNVKPICSPVYLLYPTNKTPPQEKVCGAFLSG